MSESKTFLVTIIKWRISGQGYKHLTRFSRFVLFKPAAKVCSLLEWCFIISIEHVGIGFNKSALKHGRRTFLYSTMGELVCSGQLGQERL